MTIPVNSSNAQDVARGVRDRTQSVAQSTMRLFTPNGIEVLVPLSASTDYAALFALAQSASAKALAAGWHSGPPAGLAVGEQQEQVGWVVRTTKEGRTGVAQVVDLYSTNPGWVKPFLKVYLNTVADVRQFDALSGLILAELPEYEGEGRLEKGKNPKTDKYIVPVKKPFAAVFVPNPRYDETEAQAAKAKGGAYTIPKRKFVRWADAAGSPPTSKGDDSPPPQSAGPRVADEPQTPAWLANEYRFCQDDDQFAYLEDVRRKLWAGANDDEKRVMKGASDACRNRLFAADALQAAASGKQGAGAR